MTVNFIGLNELKAKLAALPSGIQNNIMRSAVRQGANVVKDAAKENFPGSDDGPESLTGALKASIRVSPGKGSQTLAVAYVMAGTLTPAQTKKFGADSAFYALWVEKGHINRKMNDALRGSQAFKRGQRATSTSNTPPHPFMRPALDNNISAVIDAMTQTISSKLPDEVNR